MLEPVLALETLILTHHAVFEEHDDDIQSSMGVSIWNLEFSEGVGTGSEFWGERRSLIGTI